MYLNDALLGGSPRQVLFTVRVTELSEGSRRDVDRKRRLVAKDGRREINVGHVAKDTRPEPDPLVSVTVLAHGNFVVRSRRVCMDGVSPSAPAQSNEF